MAELYLRKASEADLLLLFEWANNSEVRKNAFHTDTIQFKEHKKWFSRLMRDKNQAQYILMYKDLPVGQIRLSCNNDVGGALIDYSIDERYRGQGFGTEILNLAKEAARIDLPSVKRLVGQVKCGNDASKTCFSQSGFSERFTEYEFNLSEE